MGNGKILTALAVIFIAAILFLGGCAPAYLSSKPQKNEPLVRVVLAHRLPSIKIEPKDTIWAADGRYVSLITSGQSWTATARQGRLQVRTSVGTAISDIDPSLCFRTRTSFYWNGQPLSQPLVISPESDSTLLAVSELPLEDYLVGVLAREMGNAGEAELEALKAQAVAARSYAYAKIGSKPGAAYDLESDVSHQVFDPASEGSQLIRNALEHTRGKVLTYKGRIFSPNYHSTCGGRTAMPSEVWGTPDSLYPWARSVKCDHCAASPKYRWSLSLTPGEIVRSGLGLADTTIPVTDIKVEERGRGGRVQKLKVCSPAGDTLLFRDRIRFKLSDRPLPSTWFDISCQRDDFGNVASVEITGKGYGHGVGLCQWGAMGMAREGKGYKKILKYYFQDVEITKLY